MGRRAAILTFFCFCFVLAGLACTSLLGDFDLGPEAVDAGPLSDAPPPETSGSDVVAIVQAGVTNPDVTVYVGQTAQVDASKSTTTVGTLSFAWLLVGYPAGSHVRQASLVGASSSTATFVPDVDGDYALQVTVSVDGSEATANANVHASAPQVLFAQGVAGDGGSSGSAFYTLADLDGGRAHPVLCPDVLSGASVQSLATYAGRAYDFWEAPPGGTSRFAAFTLDLVPDAGYAAHLWAGTATSTCGAPPVDLGNVGFGPGRPFGSEPHFSPDGARFVVIDQKWRIVTYAADGGSPQIVATYPVPSGQARSILDPVGVDAGGYVVEPPRVEWMNGDLWWAQPTVNGWEVVTAPDAPNAATTPYMVCKGVTPREIAILRDGTVVASYRLTPQSGENLYKLKPDAQLNCIQDHEYTSLPDSGSATATDFAVSPDETQIAFLQIDPSLQDASPWTQGGSQLPGGYVYLVAVAGGSPQLVSNEPAVYGPRWLGGGSALVYTRLDGTTPGGKLATSVIAVAPDGGDKRTVAQGDGVSTFVSTSGNATCEIARGRAAPASSRRLALWTMALFFAMASVRRHRRPVPRGPRRTASRVTGGCRSGIRA